MPDVNLLAGAVSSGQQTLAANTARSIGFATDLASVDVVNAGPGTCYYTVDGSVPTFGGTNCYPVFAGMVDTRQVPSGAATVVTLISDGTPVVHVLRS